MTIELTNATLSRILLNIIQRQDTTNADGGLLIYAKDRMRMIRKQELENSIDETLWVEIIAKGQSFFYAILIGHNGLTQITGTD